MLAGIHNEVVGLNGDFVAKPAILFTFIFALGCNPDESIETLKSIVIVIIKLSYLLFGIRILIEVSFLDEHETAVCIMKVLIFEVHCLDRVLKNLRP